MPFVASILSEKLVSRVAGEAQDTIHYLKIQSNGFQIQKKSGESPFLLSREMLDLEFTLPHAHVDHEKEAIRILAYSLCARLPLQQLSVLSFFRLHNVDWHGSDRTTALGRAWHELLAAARHAETLEFVKFTNPVAEGVLALLHSCNVDVNEDENLSHRAQLHLPNVKRLSLSCLDFTHGQGFAWTVRDALQTRISLDGPQARIEEVVLATCSNVDIKAVKVLEDTPVRVVWDSRDRISP